MSGSFIQPWAWMLIGLGSLITLSNAWHYWRTFQRFNPGYPMIPWLGSLSLWGGLYLGFGDSYATLGLLAVFLDYGSLPGLIHRDQIRKDPRGYEFLFRESQQDDRLLDLKNLHLDFGSDNSLEKKFKDEVCEKAVGQKGLERLYYGRMIRPGHIEKEKVVFIRLAQPKYKNSVGSFLAALTEEVFPQGDEVKFVFLSRQNETFVEEKSPPFFQG